MAALTASLIQVIVHRNILPYVSDNWYKASPFLAKVWKKKKTWDGGYRLSIPCEFAAMSNVTAYDGGITDITVTNSLPLVEAFYNWKYIYGYIAFEDQELIKASGSKQAAIDLIAQKRKMVTKNFSDTMATQLYGDGTSGDGTEWLTISGLQSMCNETNPGTQWNYGGISIASQSTWAALVVDKDSATYGGDGTYWVPTKDKLSKIVRQLSYTMNDRPTDIFCSKDVYGELKKLFDENEIAYNDPKKPSLGFPSFTVEGDVSVTWDPYITAAEAYVLNMDHIWFYVHPDYDMKWEQEQSMLAGSKLGRIGAIKLAGNLVTDSRDRHCRIQDISIT